MPRPASGKRTWCGTTEATASRYSAGQIAAERHEGCSFLGVPVAAVPDEAAGEHFGFLAGLLALDSPSSSALTRELLGWQPVHPGLIDDLDQDHYFDEAAA